MISRYTQLAAPLIGLLIVLSSCYLPAEFRSDVHIERSGEYRISYRGNLIHAGLLRTLAGGELDAADEPEKVAAIERDLARDPAFAQVTYLGGATFAVIYDRRGNIYRHRYFTFVRQNSLILSIGYVEESGEITVRGGAVPSSYHQQLTELGYQVRGELRVTTDMVVKDNNADQVIGDEGTTYLWLFRAIDDPPARLVIG